MPKYEIIVNDLGNEIIVRYNEDGSVSSFMKDELNADFQEYKKSLEKPSTKKKTEPIVDEA